MAVEGYEKTEGPVDVKNSSIIVCLFWTDANNINTFD